jgi:hypothetical protein
MLIRIFGRVEVQDDEGQLVTDKGILRKLDGAISDDVCSNYLDHDLADLDITEGAVKLTYDGEANQLWVVTEYRAAVKLKRSQLKQLVENTIGQWSDGIGEGCFDELADRLGVGIDLAPLGQREDLLIEQIDDGQKIPKSRMALPKAAREGDLATVRRLLSTGADLEVRQQQFTSLHLAITYGHVDVALELIARGADIKALDPLGEDPLMICAMSNGIDDADAAQIAHVLLERGVDACSPRGDAEVGPQYTPLEIAINRKKSKLAKVLRQFGATK